MGTTAQKLQAIQNSKAAIKAAIEAKGVSDVGDVLANYATKIASIATPQPGLSFTNITSSSVTVKTVSSGTPPSVTLEYSTDGGVNWTSYTLGSDVSVPVGGTVLFRAGTNGNSTLGTSNSNYIRFSVPSGLKTNGKIQYLLNQNGQTTGTAYSFCSLFRFTSGPIGHLDLSDIGDDAGDHALDRILSQNTSITSVDLSGLKQPSGAGILSTAMQSGGIEYVYAPNLVSVGNNGMENFIRQSTIITSISLPNLASVGSNGLSSAFRDCTGLRVVKIPKLSSAGSTGMWATFNGCTALELVDMSGATAVISINSNTFQNTNSTFKVVVPDSLYSSWIAATNWSSIASQIVKVSDYTPAS